MDVDTNFDENIADILGQKMIVEIYSDNIKFTCSDDTETGYDSFALKIMDDNTINVPNSNISIIVDWYIPYIHKAWNIRKINMTNKDFPNEKYVHLEYK